MALQQTFQTNEQTQKLSDVMSPKAIQLLTKFESLNTNKSRLMTHETMTTWMEFCKETTLTTDVVENILRDCCGFSCDGAKDFAKLYMA